MNWLFRKLGAAVIAGVGMKLGSDAYDALKKKFGNEEAPQPEPEPDVVRHAQAERVSEDDR